MKDLQKAIRITEDCFRLAKETIKVGITEKQLEIILKRHAMKLGADRLSFPPIISSGKNGSKIHPKPTNKKIRKNEFVIVDFGVVYNDKKTDVTRTYCISPDKEKIKLYNLLKNVQKLSEKKIKVGIPASEVDIYARKYLKKNTRIKFPYALGHGIGKKIHDVPKINPKSKHIFKEGDIFTLEPGLHSKKMGLRIEDMYLLTKKGIIKLTKNISGDLSV